MDKGKNRKKMISSTRNNTKLFSFYFDLKKSHLKQKQFSTSIAGIHILSVYFTLSSAQLLWVKYFL